MTENWLDNCVYDIVGKRLCELHVALSPSEEPFSNVPVVDHFDPRSSLVLKHLNSLYSHLKKTIPRTEDGSISRDHAVYQILTMRCMIYVYKKSLAIVT